MIQNFDFGDSKFTDKKPSDVFFFRNESIDGYTLAASSYSTGEKYLSDLAQFRNFPNVCMAIAFTNAIFETQEAGVAFVAVPESHLYGACAGRFGLNTAALTFSLE